MGEIERTPGRASWRAWAMAGVVLAAAALAAAPGARAQPAAMARVEFDDAVQRALARNPTVAEAATAVDRAAALLAQARAANLPNVGAAVSSSTLKEGVTFSGQVAQPRSQTTVSATASVPVLAAASWAAVTQSRDQVEVSQLSVVEVRQQVAVAAARAYLAIIAAKRQVEVEQRALDNAQAHRDHAQKRLRSGAGSRLDEVRADQQVASEQARLEVSHLALLDSQEALGVLLAEDGPVDAGAEPTLDVPTAVDATSEMAARPDVRLRTATAQAAERVVDDSWKDWLPTGSVAFTPQLVTPAGIFDQSPTWRFTVSFSQPLFEGGQRKAEAALRAVALDQAKLQLTAVEIAARSEIRVAQESLASYQRALARARQAAEQADEVLRITTGAFQAGATTDLEVIDAERSARDAATAAALAEDRVRQAKLDLLVALGRFPQ
jgi:outer membrane protein TolC